ncbi:efflux RND transporter permease subunit [Marivivens donghaensis]|uniref:efflux RND transporter permease subunit n=1 Tax=Marivivens donghaensis TaxID=1699413 RepID=UPI00201F2AAE|nr:efflux RND transporter permease subunit [Marivivens donghaensis]MCL7408572.1 efflux RND transporter permease subunit [Marivivens donghaensis]MDN3704657.1 efflux RND transporter permease subunit [Marivivens donghaensis]
MIRWFTGHPTAGNLLLLLFLAAGFFAAPGLLRETFPDFRAVEAEIVVPYKGATAEDVETAICAPLWDGVQSVEGLETFTCTAQAGRARAVATMAPGNDALRFVNSLRTEVSAIDTFPERADPAVVRELHRTDPVTSVAISGDLPLSELDFYADGLSDRLTALPGVARVTRGGLGTRTLTISVSRTAMEGHGLTPAALAMAIAAQNIDLPIGTLEGDGAELTVRFTAERDTAAELATIPVMVLPNGATLTLSDVALIEERFEPPHDRAFVDGAPAIVLDVAKALNADALRVLDGVATLVAEETDRLPASIKVEVVQDVTSIIRDRLVMLVQNGVIGLVLVVIVMSLFFRPGFAIWAAMGLPVAFAGAFLWMALTGLSLNMMTLVALLMAIGIVMDDSIVIADSIAVHAAEDPTVETITKGVTAVAPGVISSFLTTLAVFLPLAFLAGELGAVLEVLPVVLLAALAASLIEAFFILPHHLKGGMKNTTPSRFRTRFDAGFDTLRERGVGRLADAAIKARWLVAGLAIGALILTVGALVGGVVKREAMPEIDGDVLEARLMLPAGTPLARATEAVVQVEAALDRVNERLSPEQPAAQTLVIRRITRLGRNLSTGENGAHVATVAVDLLGAETRANSLDEIVTLWREEIGPLAGVSSLILTEPGIGPQGIAVELRLNHVDLVALEAAGRNTLAELETYAGVRNAILDLRPGATELRLTLSPGAEALGLTATDVAGQLRAAFLGTQLSEIRRADLAWDLEVRLPDIERVTRADLNDFKIALPDGVTVPLSSIVTIDEARGWGGITRRNGLRTLTIAADVDGRIGNADAITAQLVDGFLPDLVSATPGLDFEVGGQAANSAETVASILRGFLIGLVGIYIVLSFQFRSYVEPIIVMITIPLAFLGVIWGHVLMGYNISMPSLVGAASLAGIVVNNAILLVGVINERRAEGLSAALAAGEAVRSRFRPIFVSVSTTIMGMAPLLFETSTQAQTLKPLVISVVFGLLAATVLILLVLPAFYAALEDIRPRKPFDIER